MKDTMTNRDFYNAVISANISDELTAYATNALAKMDAANEKRRNTPTKAQKENAPVIEAIQGVLNGELQTASDIAAAVGISTQKASALLRGLVTEGYAVAEDVKVPKKGVVKGYKLAE